MAHIRAERPSDEAAIAQLVQDAFRSLPHSSHTEHFIIDALRGSGALSISLVAEADGQVIGHIAFSPVTISDGSRGWYGLGPVAVRPELQRQGVGQALVQAGLAALEELGARGCVVLGEPEYYRRFGFRNNNELTLEGVPQEFFLSMTFGEKAARGQVTYHASFGLAPEVTMEPSQEQAGLAWQIGVWDRISEIYLREIDRRFAPVVEQVIARAHLTAREHVLDLGTGTGAVTERAAQLVGPEGLVVGVDISSDMLRVAQERMAARGLTTVRLREGRAEAIPVEDRVFDVALASLSLMYVIDRAAAARELARVLRPKGRLIAAVWAGPEECDIVQFQQTAGRFAGPPPVPGVGPGALADPAGFLRQLADVGIEARVERETLGFDFRSFAAAWDVLAGVTTAHLEPERQQEAKAAVMAAMYPQGDAPRHFRNTTQFIVGHRG